MQNLGKGMKLFVSYIKTHIKSAVLLMAMFITYAVILFFYRVPVMVTVYCSAVMAFLTILIVAIDFGRYGRRHEALRHMKHEITDAMDHLPLPQDLIEEDYQQIIRASFEDRMEKVYDADHRYHDMMEYYTMWVHQIKTPIAAMKLLLQTGDLKDKEKGELMDELFRIEQYVEMVLCYLRLDGEGSDYVIREWDLDSIIRQALRKFASQFIRNHCLLVYEPVQCRVMTDEKWLLFVIEQVLSNGLKYTRMGQGQIEIEMESPMILVIRDSGIGIAPEDLPRIFERGYTGYNGRADKKSTGLGLYLCRRITENLGHRIWAESVVGEGTEIRIDLGSYRLTVE